ncbi:MAG TPA: V4R domain-containing protein [Gemmatimonadaceae bacterium]|nr:V4R domain-containing protein [Gemmatimonadaceae bacterium]
MSSSLDLSRHDLMAVSRASLATLRSALVRDNGPTAAAALQEAGFAGGAAVFDAFRAWLRARGEGDPGDLDLADFQREAADFFHETGWGSIQIGSLHDAVAVVDSSDWSEASPGEHLEHPGCHYSTGMLAYFFGQFADGALGALEVECRSAGAARCRFLLGNTDVMQYLFAALERGEAYDAAAGRIGAEGKLQGQPL